LAVCADGPAQDKLSHEVATLQRQAEAAAMRGGRERGASVTAPVRLRGLSMCASV
jgi:hypothetical protein